MNLSLERLVISPFIAWVLGALILFFYLFTFDGIRPVLRQDRINFGIDLVGGTYITLEVQTDKAIEAELMEKLQVVLKKMENENLLLPTSHKFEGQRIILTYETLDAVTNAASWIKGIEPGLNVVTDGLQLRISFKENEAQRIKDWAVKGNIEVLRTRLDAMGVGEVAIAQQGEKNIIIELPNVNDPVKAKERIGKAALLEVKPVERAARSQEELLDEFDGELPEDMQILRGREGNDQKEYYLVPKYTDLTGRLLKDAYAGFGGGDHQGQMVVNFEFKSEGDDKFYEMTKKNLGRRIAIIIDDVVVTAPSVSTPISGGRAYIYGGFSTESANELAMLLKSGAFVAPVTFEEERQIGPSLGQESINKGILACWIGLALLIVFSIVVYSYCGFFAFLALLYNLLLLLVFLSWLGATLTLPGIAGMVLTIGMAIDASVLIYEKIREELAAGITPRQAVKDGFSDAMGVILDSNITTFLMGIVLYKFGTGPIQGFAVTMMVGIISTLITGLFFLKSLFNYVLYNLGVQKLRI